MPLTLAPIDVELTVVRLPREEKIRKHLESLGIVPHATLRVLSSVRGNIIVEVLGARVALDHDVAKGIVVVAH